MQKTPTNESLSTERNKSLPIEITRHFIAPVDLVWMAWTSPEFVQQWWGPDNYTCPLTKIDLHVGGKYLFCMQGPDGKKIYSGGVYRELVPNEKLVYTDNFTDRNGNTVPASHYGMPEEFGETLVTVKLTRSGDYGCMMIMTHAGIPAGMHDDCVEGWNQSFDKMQKVVERH